MTNNLTKSPQTAFAAGLLGWAFGVAALALAACGGGGGGGGSTSDSPAPTPAPPAPPPAPAVVLNAQEELAYQAWALREVTERYVTDTDDTFSGGNLSVGGRLRFAGKYPPGTGAGTGAGNNLPSLVGNPSGLCKSGGSKNQVDTLINNNSTFDAGESYVVTYTDCKEVDFVLNGTQKISYRSTNAYYPPPDNKAIKSAQFDELDNYAYSVPSLGYSGSLKGTLSVDIADTPLRRTYTLKDVAYTFDQGSVVGNLSIAINRAEFFGVDQPFSVQSISSSATVDGKLFTISSTVIPWRSVYGYIPRSGSMTAVAASGEKIVIEYTANGAKCSLVPLGTTTASVTVEQCSRIR
jgi:hypothetical protein